MAKRGSKQGLVKLSTAFRRWLGDLGRAPHYVTQEAADAIEAARGLYDSAEAAIEAAGERLTRFFVEPSYSDYRRATPAENVKLGASRKARHYVLKNVKRVTKRTPSITARAHETLRTRQVHGMASPEQATQARREGGLSYSSHDQAERVAKAGDRRLRKKAEENVGKWLPYSSPKKGSARLHFTRERMDAYERNRERKLRGEWLDDGDWFAMMDAANALRDHRIMQLRASPAPSGYAIGR